MAKFFLRLGNRIGCFFFGHYRCELPAIFSEPGDKPFCLHCKKTLS